MATTARPITSPLPPTHPPPHGRSTSAPPKSAPTTASPPSNSPAIEYVSESAYEFLLAEILQWVERDEKRIADEARRVQLAAQELKDQKEGSHSQNDNPSQSQSQQSQPQPSDNHTEEDAAAAVIAAERSAARIERMGYDVGYRLCERLAQHRPLLGPGSPSPETNAESSPSPAAALAGNTAADASPAGNPPIVMGGGHHHTTMDAKTQLEAVKFLCKEFWTEVFRKQIDKLQTNHRGVFVLKDQELKWLKRLPPDEESARVGAIRILAFPCGLIRGALGCLGLNGAVVSCDFLADGRSMASCSFNIKVK
mmetsp:Transcript_29077/g.62249  ORF Transcript_29077/g.62249 Transcript_29077/m.62249 type:complete len:310 (-) Transcript_29077:310-1239(-)